MWCGIPGAKNDASLSPRSPWCWLMSAVATASLVQASEDERWWSRHGRVWGCIIIRADAIPNHSLFCAQGSRKHAHFKILIYICRGALDANITSRNRNSEKSTEYLRKNKIRLESVHYGSLFPVVLGYGWRVCGVLNRRVFQVTSN